MRLFVLSPQNETYSVYNHSSLSYHTHIMYWTKKQQLCKKKRQLNLDHCSSGNNTEIQSMVNLTHSREKNEKRPSWISLDMNPEIKKEKNMCRSVYNNILFEGSYEHLGFRPGPP